MGGKRGPGSFFQRVPRDASPGEPGGRGVHRFSKVLGAQGRQEAPTPPVAAPNPWAQIGGGRRALLERWGDSQPFRHRHWQERDNLVIRMLSGSLVCSMSKRLLLPCYEWRTIRGAGDEAGQSPAVASWCFRAIGRSDSLDYCYENRHFSTHPTCPHSHIHTPLIGVCVFFPTPLALNLAMTLLWPVKC